MFVGLYESILTTIKDAKTFECCCQQRRTSSNLFMNLTSSDVSSRNLNSGGAELGYVGGNLISSLTISFFIRAQALNILSEAFFYERFKFIRSSHSLTQISSKQSALLANSNNDVNNNDMQHSYNCSLDD